ncbi:MAG: polysaccharide export outer membrane protein [Oleiphilaceae bacterium]|jgi:polysaccharide export outer membrane protein
MFILNLINRSCASKSKSLVVICIFAVLQGCGGNKQTLTLDEFNDRSQSSMKQDLNEQIRSAALLGQPSDGSDLYVLGAGDLVEVSVFRIEDLNRTVRINGDGEMFLPLLGILKVKGLSLPVAEQLIADKLSADYIQNAQVSLFVKEYRSQEVTVMGAVNKPDIYKITRSRGVVEMLSLAGGVSEQAADTIRVSSTVLDKETGLPVKRNFVLSINGLLSDREALAGIRLKGGDAVFVPEAGVVYVEGSVKNPGAYKMTGDVTVLQALSLAGGPKWESDQSSVRVVRDLNGVANAVRIDLNKVRNQKSDDLVLQDGDIVIVDYGQVKQVVSGFLNGVRSFVGFGYRIN